MQDKSWADFCCVLLIEDGLVLPQPMIAESLPAYWSGSELAGAKQTGEIASPKITGDSRVKMAMSFTCYIKRQTDQISFPLIVHR